jgi:SAM-dependent methyltransferase
MSDGPTERPRDDHNWHSLGYVDQWITKDLRRDDERRPMLDLMMSFADLGAKKRVRILDLAAGYGAVTDAVMRAFPEAEVTLQDFSQQMLDRAREHLSSRFPRTRYVRCDMTQRGWMRGLGGSFDLVASAIGIHNIDSLEQIRACYADIAGLVALSGCFLNCDYFDLAGGVDVHMKALRDAGFPIVDCPWRDDKHAIVRARRQE